jgi:hypothetical protein
VDPNRRTCPTRYDSANTGDGRGGVSLRDGELLVERSPNELDELAIARLVEEREANDYWRPAMPLDEMYGNRSAGTNIRVAPADQMTPHLEVNFPTDEFDRASLSNAIEAHVGGETIDDEDDGETDT